ncbi:MAG: hypothetical protein V4582_23280 [Pseudomonadota bacterium]
MSAPIASTLRRLFGPRSRQVTVILIKPLVWQACIVLIPPWRIQSACRSMPNSRSFLALLIAAFASGADAKTSCSLARLTPHASTLQLNGETIDLGEADSALNPSAWQGPLRSKRCRFALGIIEAPLVLLAGKWLYVPTFSGSIRHLTVLDMASCKVRWTSQPFSGAFDIDGGAVTMDGRRVPLDARCLPAQAK